jgi:hypothetical protein
MLHRLAAGLLLPCSLVLLLPASAEPTRDQASEARAQRMRGAANAGIDAHPAVQGTRSGADPVLERAVAALRVD